MTNEETHLDPIEERLIELHEADRAGVFLRTRVEPESWDQPMRRPRTGTARRLALRLAAVAAVLAVAAGVWTTLFRAELARLRDRSVVEPGAVLVATSEQVNSFDRCLKGPSGAFPSGDCRAHDADADGDVDLRDFSAFQLAYVGPGR